MPDRKLKFFDWEKERLDMTNLLEWVVGTHPYLKNMQIPVKAYQIVDHGQIPEEAVELINANDIAASLRRFRAKIFSEKNWQSWQSGVGGVFYENGRPAYFIPMIDMEIISTPDPKRDAQQIENQLKALDIDCSIVRSGDVGRGGYFIVGHDPVPYYPYYWQFMGKVLVAFSVGESEGAQKARELGGKLMTANNEEEAKVVAGEILTAFKSIKTGQERDGVLCDPRWLGYKVRDGFTILRQTPGKSYEDRPLQVAGFY